MRTHTTATRKRSSTWEWKLIWIRVSNTSTFSSGNSTLWNHQRWHLFKTESTASITTRKTNNVACSFRSNEVKLTAYLLLFFTSDLQHVQLFYNCANLSKGNPSMFGAQYGASSAT
jgi:hypothetical protein